MRRHDGGRLLAAALLVAQAFLLVTTALDKSDTLEEPVYLDRASWYFTNRVAGEMPSYWMLPQWAFAVALYAADPSLSPPSDRHIALAERWVLDRYEFEDRGRVLFATRLTTIVATLIGGLLLWLAARRFGEGPGLVALALWCFSPTVLANGCLANVNSWLATFMCGILWATFRFVERPTPLRAALVGAMVALAIGTKMPAVAVVPVVVGVGSWALWRRDPAPGSGSMRRALDCAVLFSLALFFALWAGYGFTFGMVRGDVLARYGPLFREALLRRGIDISEVWGPVPFPVWFETQLTQGAKGWGSEGLRLGTIAPVFFAMLAFKVTLGAQALTLLRVAATIKALPSRRSMAIDAALLAYPVLLFAGFCTGRAIGGVRYLLPAFPFAMVWAGRGFAHVRDALGRTGLVLVMLALGVGAAETLAIHPHHLMYFNLWAGGPEGGPRHLVFGDDWFQDQKRLGQWQQEHNIPMIYYTAWHGRPESWRIDYRQVPCKPRKGYFALQAFAVHRPGVVRPMGCLDWLTVEPPDERIGYSIYLYFVTRDRLKRLEERRGTKTPFFRSGPASP